MNKIILTIILGVVSLANTYAANSLDDRDYANFLNSKLVYAKSAMIHALIFNDKYIQEGKFPELEVDSPATVKMFMGGDYEVKVRWFDSQLNEVTSPSSVGRYGYYAEIVGANGVTLKRIETAFCAESGWLGGWNLRMSADLDYFDLHDITPQIWDSAREEIGDYVGYHLQHSITSGEDSQMLLAYLDEIAKGGYESGINPIIMDCDYYIQIKQKVLDVDTKYKELKLPKATKQCEPLSATANNNPKYREMQQELDIFLKRWNDETEIPFNVLIAHKGETLFHSSYGELRGEEYTVESTTEVASITKLFTGILFAQFLDQGILRLDDRVSDYLPDFNRGSLRDITLRQCFYHLVGYDGHGLFGGMHNACLESVLALVADDVEVGSFHKYNGLSYDLVAKVMEIVSGKSLFRLTKEQIFDPLGLEHTTHYENSAYSIHSNAYDLAKVAQMMLNKGSYNGVQLFSKQTYKEIMPKVIADYFPNGNTEDMIWGVGVKDLSVEGHPNYHGHGSATCSMLNFDIDNDIIITMSRLYPGNTYGDYKQPLFDIIDKYLK